LSKIEEAQTFIRAKESNCQILTLIGLGTDLRQIL